MDKPEPIHHKLTEALEGHEPPAIPKGHDRAGPVPDDAREADVELHNAQVHKSRTDHLIDVGRADKTSGRQ